MKTQVVDQFDFDKEIKIDDFVLSIPSIDDADELYDFIQSNFDHIGEFINKPFKMDSIEKCEKWIEKINKEFENNEAVKYLIKIDGKIIGEMDIINISWTHGNAEFGYLLSKDYIGNGYIYKSIKKLENILFNLGFEKIVIRASTTNLKSVAVAKNNNYKKDGVLRNNYFLISSQDYRDSAIYSKLKLEYEKER